ncbi:unnamed protein product [Effrenium voratum]|nr:unnamed protein product [Effrenium voratum]
MPVTRLAEMAMQARLQGLRRFAAPARPAKAAKAAPRWPFLRLRALSAELQTFLAGEGGELWVTGSPGSGASTAILSVLPNHPAVVLDAEKGEQQMQDTFRRQLAEQLGDREELAEECIAAVLEEHPQAGEALVATVERAARLGLPAALPAGTEVPACRELAQKHRTQPQRLCSSACGVLLQQQRLQLQPASRLHVALALLSEAGRREGGVAGALDFLLAAAKRSRLTLVLLRAQLAPRFLQRATETRAGGSLRLLAQSYDGLAALRARESGVPVLTAEEWSEEMARAIFQPRFIPEEDQRDWRAVWAAVGGHPAHLRQLAELLAGGWDGCIYVPEQLVAGDQNAQAGYGIIVNGVKFYSRENIGYVLIENPKKDDLNAAIIASSELSEHQACASECYNFLAARRSASGRWWISSSTWNDVGVSRTWPAEVV